MTPMNDLRPLFPTNAAAGPRFIVGPCSAETEEQTLATARALAAEGFTLFRAGLWKPRTRPGGFEGVGTAGLAWLDRVRRETGMLVATEVATRDHVRAVLDAGIDLVWIGARTAGDPFAMQELADALAGHDLPVLVKNPASPDLELWIGALQRLYNAGLRRLGAIHRGFATLDGGAYRNPPLWALPIELRRRLPQLPLLCDPSHIGGRRDLVASLARQALDMGFDGLVVEAHCAPDEAWSDSAQQLSPAELGALVRTLVVRRDGTGAASLAALRERIDRTDDELLALLARRMEIVREIGEMKRREGLPVLQTGRYGELLDRLTARAAGLGLHADFVRRFMQLVHEEAVRQQIER